MQQTAYEDVMLQKLRDILQQKPNKKPEVDLVHFQNRINDASQHKFFSTLAQRIRTITKLPAPQLTAIDTLLQNLQLIMDDYATKKKQISIKINKFLLSQLNRFLDGWSKQTFAQAFELQNAAMRLQQAGTWGSGDVIKNFNTKYEKFECTCALWMQLHELESEQSLIFDENQVKQLLIEFWPKEKIIRVQVPVDRIVEKIVTKEVIVQKVVEKPVFKEVIKEVIKYNNFQQLQQQPQTDVNKLLHAHEAAYGINRSQDIQYGLQLYREINNIQSNNAIGQIYMEGRHVQQDIELAQQHYQIGLQQNNEEALYQSGKMLMIGKQEIMKGFTQMKQAADMNHLDACIDVGLIYNSGIKKAMGYLIEPNKQTAEQYISKAKSIPRGMHDLATLQENFDMAVKYYKLSIDMGYTQGYYSLGRLYEQNNNPKEATIYYRQGALLQDLKCIEGLLEHLYEEALDMEQVDKFESYLKSLLVQHQSGSIYYYLGLIEEDSRLRLKYFQRGAHLLNDKCLVKLGDILKDVKYYYQAANMGNTEAHYKVGLHFDKLKQYDKAIEHFEKSQLKEAYSKLSEYYEHGYGVDVNMKLAAHYNKLSEDIDKTMSNVDNEYNQEVVMSIIFGNPIHNQ